MSLARNYSTLDRLLIEAERALATAFAPAPVPGEANPAGDLPDPDLDDSARRHAAGLMRINHTGEVCAQALYFGQASVSRDAELRAHLHRAAAEEIDHLAWCAERLQELRERPSVFNPLWYAGSFALGAAAGLVGDRVSLGFVVETERQVEAHLGDHLERLPEGDERSRAIVRRMQADEARHAEDALERGAVALPQPVPRLMAAAAGFMKWVAYRL
ncbi:MAG TPA: 2-polyprenyl-3-methyl-6-methoxy-1,4-benzoquinone monooxygenase [Xanthomonadaceae bacterium]|nr:2-polyprenyl-3-methyl-6-methoxy-1,4-benzoquinone monooxygenase [Xanthomonadaceae bacterium]